MPLLRSSDSLLPASTNMPLLAELELTNMPLPTELASMYARLCATLFIFGGYIDDHVRKLRPNLLARLCVDLAS